jgi:hypothetical protein
MSRYERYGGNNCLKCKWYQRSRNVKVPVARCFYPGNTHVVWFGQAFHKRPSDINWNKKCEWYEEEQE